MDDYRSKELREAGITADVEWDGHGPAVVTLDIVQLDALIATAHGPDLAEAARMDGFHEGQEDGYVDGYEYGIHEGDDAGYARAIADIESLADAS